MFDYIILDKDLGNHRHHNARPYNNYRHSTRQEKMLQQKIICLIIRNIYGDCLDLNTKVFTGMMEMYCR